MNWWWLVFLCLTFGTVTAVKNQSKLLVNIDGRLPINLVYGTWTTADNLQEYGEWRSLDGTFDCMEQTATDVIIVKATDTQMPANFFERYANIERLEMTNKQLQSIETTDLLFAQSLIRLNVSHNRIDRIGAHAFEAAPKLMEIDLSFNLLYNLNENIFTSYLIKYLYLHNNRLDAVNPLWFENLLYLRVLTLNNNRIRTIDWRMVDFWPSINILHLHANEITEVMTTSPTNQPPETPRSLQTFTIHANPVADASHQLIWLDAERIDVRNTSVHTLRIAHRMQTILAANNDIDEINLDQLIAAPHENALVTLDLAENRLKSLENVTHFHHLHYLNVSHNLLGRIDHRVFATLNELRQLDLSHNQLKRFDMQNQHVPRLTLLDISFNEIITLELNGIAQQLDTLNIIGNRIKGSDLRLKKVERNTDYKDHCAAQKPHDTECRESTFEIDKRIQDFIHAQIRIMEANIMKKINGQLKSIRKQMKHVEEHLVSMTENMETNARGGYDDEPHWFFD